MSESRVAMLGTDTDRDIGGPALAVRTALARLTPLGVSRVTGSPGGQDHEPSKMLLAPAASERDQPHASATSVSCEISWYGPAGFPPDRPGSEASAQALCGLMEVHGRDAGRPRRLGLEIASVAAGVLAAQGVLAALVAQSRGRPVSVVRTSALQAGLLQASHYVAAATCPAPPAAAPAPPGDGPSPGPPPFATSDGHWFEMETLDPEAWKSFWTELGAGQAELGRAWAPFRSRYFTGSCSLPAGITDATRRRTFSEVSAVARASGVSLTPLRRYSDVLLEPGLDVAHPLLEEFGPELSSPPPPATAEQGSSSASGLPLEGIRVVETTSRLQGPLAGLLLQMLGASVLRVEPPGGDFARMVAPLAGDTGSFFLCFNRAKQCVELDLATPPGRAELLDLIAGADVFLHNWRPGKAREWALDGDDLARHNPRLVYADPSGWGSLAQSSQLVGTDFLVQAYAGLGDGLNPEDEAPSPSRVLLTDFMGALVACEGILAGLYRREQSGRGCRVRTSLLGGAMTLQAHVLEALAEGHENGRRQGRPVWGTLDHPVESEDGFIAVSIESDTALRRVCRICSVDPGEMERAKLEQRLAATIRTASSGYWEKVLLAEGIPCATVCTDLAGLPADPRMADLLEPLGGTSWAPATPWGFGQVGRHEMRTP